MLQRGDDARRLQAPDIGAANRAYQVGILADCLLDPSPAKVAHHVQHRGQALVHSERPHRLADLRAHLLHELRVEARPPAQRRRVDGRLPRRKARQALFVHERRDPEPRGPHDPSLEAGEAARTDQRLHWGRPVRPGQLAEAVAYEQLPVGRGGGEVVLMGRYLPGFVSAQPQAVQLARPSPSWTSCP